MAFSSFAVAAYTSDSSLTSDKIFPAISLYMLLQFPLVMFSMVTTNIIEAMVSIKRLSDFFAADELQTDVREVVESAPLEQGDVVVSVTNGEFCWNKNAVSPSLEDINLVVRKGELIGVLGRVGAGKVCFTTSVKGGSISSPFRPVYYPPSLAKCGAQRATSRSSDRYHTHHKTLGELPLLHMKKIVLCRYQDNERND